jgi:prepilin-type N-terminal cleavage/methylation domain-containing protein
VKLIPKLRLKAKAGFTLVELIMAIVVVGIVSVPLSLLLSQHIESTFQSEDLTIATNLARFEMEKVNNLAYASIVNATFSNYEGYGYDLTRTFAYAQGSGLSTESLKKVTVQVRKSGSAAVLVSLISYIAKNISYGL